ncbi:MAG: glycoside hydrolase N-terminal domain-containing protein, partial [Clostridia bacterium]|nr:glycoside hydrolase N-terminal domain-containing protein [Clostridia bacterium]
MKDGHFLFYDRPAAYWQEALPLGNGALGAMVFGGTEEEKISLNHDTLWSGRPGLENGFPGRHDYSAERSGVFRKARDLALNGKYKEAEVLVEKEFQGEDSEAYLPLGDLHISFSGKGEIADYRRTLDLSRAVAECTFSQNGVKKTRRAFVSCPDGVMVMIFESEGEEDIAFSFSSPLKSESTALDGRLILRGEAPSYFDRRNTEHAYYYLPEEENRGMSFAACLAVRTDGRVEEDGRGLSLRNAKKSVVLLAAGTSFRGFDRHPHLEGIDPVPGLLEKLQKAGEKSADELLARHVRDHESFYGRMELDLGSDGKESLPTDRRLREFEKDKNDRGLYALIFNFGRYLLIAGSRPGSEPLNLQGIWNDQALPPWNSNYTTNINTEMNYWPALPTGLFEMTEPLTRMIRELRVTGRRTAAQYYGAPGFVLHHNTDIWRLSVPVQGMAQWSFWPMGSGWLCRHLYEYYEYTLDLDFLRNEAYPAMREAAEFYLSLLSEDGEGRLLFAPGTSPENGYRRDGVRVTVSKTAAMTAEILADLFRNLLKAEKELGISELSPRLEKTLERLWMPGIGSRGQLNEWYAEEED